jgi:hypothetical protein
MIKLYCRTDCPRCRSLAEALRELAIRCEVIRVPPGEPVPPELGEEAELPVLTDEDSIFRGPEAILDHLEELEGLKEDWYRFQSDVCYCEE